MTVHDVIRYLDIGMTLEELQKLTESDLARLEGMLNHWHQLAEKEQANRKVTTHE